MTYGVKIRAIVVLWTIVFTALVQGRGGWLVHEQNVSREDVPEAHQGGRGYLFGADVGIHGNWMAVLEEGWWSEQVSKVHLFERARVRRGGQRRWIWRETLHDVGGGFYFGDGFLIAGAEPGALRCYRLNRNRWERIANIDLPSYLPSWFYPEFSRVFIKGDGDRIAFMISTSYSGRFLLGNWKLWVADWNEESGGWIRYLVSEVGYHDYVNFEVKGDLIAYLVHRDETPAQQVKVLKVAGEGRLEELYSLDLPFEKTAAFPRSRRILRDIALDNDRLYLLENFAGLDTSGYSEFLTITSPWCATKRRRELWWPTEVLFENSEIVAGDGLLFAGGMQLDYYGNGYSLPAKSYSPLFGELKSPRGARGRTKCFGDRVLFSDATRSTDGEPLSEEVTIYRRKWWRWSRSWRRR